MLIKNYSQRRFLEIEWEDLVGYNEILAHNILERPLDYLNLLDEVATEVGDEITKPRPLNEGRRFIQIKFSSKRQILGIRDLDSKNITKLQRICGMVTSCSADMTKTHKVSMECCSCGNFIKDAAFTPGHTFPPKCNATGIKKCTKRPYFMVQGKSRFVNFQRLKVQELPESIPQGDVARHLDVHCVRSLCGLAVPGNRVIIHGVYCVSFNTTKNNIMAHPYFLAIDIKIDNSGGFVSRLRVITDAEETTFKNLSSLPNIYEILAKSIAPEIYGLEDIKKAIVCLLFSGSQKIFEDDSLRRADINMLMVGDPGIAKSQLLKFVGDVSPIGVFTSGRGSSAVGLTASVVRDPITKNFVVAGGAMVLANGGVVCIDEFDKMQEGDRVAIHEAMEQVKYLFQNAMNE
jgi:DNA replication licensing factor MCM5